MGLSPLSERRGLHHYGRYGVGFGRWGRILPTANPRISGIGVLPFIGKLGRHPTGLGGFQKKWLWPLTAKCRTWIILIICY